MEEARYAWHLLGDDKDHENHEQEVTARERMTEIKELIPTLPPQ
tara:strand:- start:824 stop:955 length:132 start_codon:yes stop_codon:yes gene_type:complete